jgi:hypothetical protein
MKRKTKLLPGETIHSGASKTCNSCGVTPPFEVFRSNAGFYIGTYCNCGPYTRESHYYKTFKEAKTALDSNTVKWRT